MLRGDPWHSRDIRSVVAAEVEAVTMELMYLIDVLNPVDPQVTCHRSDDSAPNDSPESPPHETENKTENTYLSSTHSTAISHATLPLSRLRLASLGVGSTPKSRRSHSQIQLRCPSAHQVSIKRRQPCTLQNWPEAMTWAGFGGTIIQTGDTPGFDGSVLNALSPPCGDVPMCVSNQSPSNV
jgi:hypothetical protein